MTEDYLGIDPGLSGGFAVVSGDKIRYKMVMPTLSFGNTKDDKTKTEIDREGVSSFLKIFPPHTHVVIEQQEAYRSQNITSTCTTCKNYGILLMALTVARFYITEVPASVWQEHYGIVSVKKSGGESTKLQAYKVCRLRYPYDNFRKSSRAFKPHDGIVDAVLIARYCQSLFAPFQEAVTGVQYISRRDETPLELKNINIPGRVRFQLSTGD
jgi:Holliday junction resolvasome RuvABC endonuclease subunit